MTKEELEKIRKRITELQQQQMNLKTQCGQHYQAIAEIKEAFAQLEARIEELRMLFPEEKKNGAPSV